MEIINRFEILRLEVVLEGNVEDTFKSALVELGEDGEHNILWIYDNSIPIDDKPFIHDEDEIYNTLEDWGYGYYDVINFAFDTL